MIKIAICDDEEIYRDCIFKELINIESRTTENFEIKTFSCGEDLCESLLTEHYDIILLDILMNGMNGLEVSERLYNLNNYSLVIFVSSFDENLRDLFGTKTIAFIDKPIDNSKLEVAINKALKIMKDSSNAYFYFEKNRTTQYIPLKSIVYFECRRNKVYICTEKYTEDFTGTITAVWDQLKDTNEFIMPHKSYIFNLAYINIKSDKVIIRTLNSSFNIGKKYKEDTIERYSKIVEERWKRGVHN